MSLQRESLYRRSKRLVVMDMDSTLIRIEVIDELAAPLPARMIGWLMGFPEDDWRRLKGWSEQTIVLGAHGPYRVHIVVVG